MKFLLGCNLLFSGENEPLVVRSLGDFSWWVDFQIVGAGTQFKISPLHIFSYTLCKYSFCHHNCHILLTQIGNKPLYLSSLFLLHSKYVCSMAIVNKNNFCAKFSCGTIFSVATDQRDQMVLQEKWAHNQFFQIYSCDPLLII